MGAACPGMGSARAVPELQRVSEPPERRVSGLPERVWELPEPQRQALEVALHEHEGHCYSDRE